MSNIWRKIFAIISLSVVFPAVLGFGLAQETPEPTDSPLFTIPTATPTSPPTATPAPARIRELVALGLQPGDVPSNFSPAEYNGSVEIAELLDQLSDIFPGRFNAIRSLISLYELNNVLGSSVADYFTESCIGQPIFGVGTWIRDLPDEDSAAALATNSNLTLIYEENFNWREIENDSLPGRMFVAPVREAVCELPGEQILVEYPIDRFIVTVSVYALDTTDDALVETILQNIIQAVSQRIQPSTVIVQIPTATSADMTTPVPAASPTPTSTPTQEIVADFGYTESFDDNSRGWNLRSTNRWTIQLVRGRLSISVDDDQQTGVAIPDLNADEYYIEVTAIPQRDRGFAGFIVGDFSEALHYLVIGRQQNFTDWFFRIERVVGNQITILEETTIRGRDESLLQPGQPITLGLERKDGVFTLYLDGEPVGSIELAGSNAALGITSGNFGSNAVLFDDLILQSSRE